MSHSDDWGNPNDTHANDKPGDWVWVPVLMLVLALGAVSIGMLLGT